MRLVVDLIDNNQVPEGVVTFEGDGSEHSFLGWLEFAALIERAQPNGVEEDPVPHQPENEPQLTPSRTSLGISLMR
jgi:hypothetical protein